MAQHDYVIANGTGAAVRSDLNNALAAIVTQNSGATEPTTTYAYQWWADTSTGLLKIRNGANNAWITLRELDGTLTVEDGTASAPGLAFADDLNTGIYRPGADQLGITTNGVVRLTASTSAVTSSLPVDVPLGTVSAPSLTFTGDLNTGIYSPGADQVAVATNGVQRVNFNAATEVVFNDGGADVDFRIEGDTEPNLFKIDAGTDQVQVKNLNGGPLAGTRNRIINGNFDIWQRGTSTGSWVAPISNYYWPDRWVFTSAGTGGNGSLSQQAFTLGQTDVPGEPTYFMRWQITSAASGQTAGSAYVEQRIEDVRTLAGQTATISFYAKGTGTLPNIYLTQTFGSGGSAQVLYTLASNVALNAGWTKYTYTVNVGSISGKTIGTNHYVGLTFMVPINSTYTLDLAQVQVEAGTVATPFERRSYGQELALCQRYYEKSYAADVAIGSASTLDGAISNVAINSVDFYTFGQLRWQVRKRASPTFTTYNPITGTLSQFRGVSDNSNAATVTAANIGESGVLRVACASANLTGNYVYAYHYIASAEL